jgi:hypothetical protein
MLVEHMQNMIPTDQVKGCQTLHLAAVAALAL